MLQKFLVRKLKSKLQCLFFICLVSFLFPPVIAYSANNSDFSSTSPVIELDKLLANFSSMSANFEQFVVDKSGRVKNSKEQHVYGTMAIVKPGKFRWEAKGTANQLIIANNDTVWIYDVDLEQVLKREIDYNDPTNPAILLSNTRQNIQAIFNITKLSMPGVGKWFELKPKSQDGASTYKWLKLHFADGKLVAMYIADNLGQYTEIVFDNVVINKTIPASIFVFVPPKGVDVID